MPVGLPPSGRGEDEGSQGRGGAAPPRDTSSLILSHLVAVRAPALPRPARKGRVPAAVARLRSRVRSDNRGGGPEGGQSPPPGFSSHRLGPPRGPVGGGRAGGRGPAG